MFSGRSSPHLLAIVTDLKARGIALRPLTGRTDTTTPHGELLLSLFGRGRNMGALTRDGGAGRCETPGRLGRRAPR